MDLFRFEEIVSGNGEFQGVALIRIKMVNYYLDRSRHSCRFLVTFPRGPV